MKRATKGGVVGDLKLFQVFLDNTFLVKFVVKIGQETFSPKCLATEKKKDLNEMTSIVCVNFYIHQSKLK